MKLTSKLKIALKSLLSVSLSEVETDKAVLVFDGELAEGIEVFVKDEEAEDGVKPAEDGTYETETQIIEVADGKVVKISEKEKVEEISAEKQKFNKIKAAFEDTYSERYQKIAEAIYKKEGNDCYIIDASDSFAIVEMWVDDSSYYHVFKYDISFAEDGSVTVGDGVEVKNEYITSEEKEHLDKVREGKIALAEITVETPLEDPADEPEDKNETPSLEDRIAALENVSNEIKSALEQILNGISGIEGRVDSLEEKVNKLDETPADEPADDNSGVDEAEHTKAYYLRKQK